jgi:hypothetical protein
MLKYSGFTLLFLLALINSGESAFKHITTYKEKLPNGKMRYKMFQLTTEFKVSILNEKFGLFITRPRLLVHGAILRII